LRLRIARVNVMARKEAVSMRNVTLLTLAALLVAGASLAQPRRSAETPIDHGPFTPEANSAFQGGGMILQGAPGAPPPRPEPTPPGQTPRNMVPPR
jgi:hypothetical protein